MGKYKVNDEEFAEAVKRSYSYAGVCRAIGLAAKGGNYATIKNRIAKLNLDTTHFTGQLWSKGKKLGENYFGTQTSLEDILEKGLPYASDRLKTRIINAGIKERKCECCGLTEWNGQNIPLELHHINGNHSDNHLENLQILCSNCHALTDNYRKRKTSNSEPKEKIYDDELYVQMTDEEIRIEKESLMLAKRKKILKAEAKEMLLNSPNQSIEDFPVLKTKLKDIVCPICGKTFHPRYFEQKYCSEECMHKSQQKAERPTKEEFLKIVVDFGVNFTQLGKHFGVTDNAIRKWCKFYGIPHLKKELQEYIKTK